MVFSSLSTAHRASLAHLMSVLAFSRREPADVVPSFNTKNPWNVLYTMIIPL